MEQNNFEQQVSTPMPPKPDNNLVLAINLHNLLLLATWYCRYR